MRDYGSIAPTFWTRGTGKQLRGDTDAQLVALYLMTSPHSTAIGIFHCPVSHIAYETGLTIEGASKGLQRLVSVGFCQFDADTDEVFVVTMASYQIAETLAPADKRVVWVQKELLKVGSALLRNEFVATYSVAFNLSEKRPVDVQNTRPLDAPSMPHRSQEQEQEQDIEQKRERVARPGGGAGKARLSLSLELDPEAARTAGVQDIPREMAIFRDHWAGMEEEKAIKTDSGWQAAWRTWCRRYDPAKAPPAAAAPPPGPKGRDPVLQALDAADKAPRSGPTAEQRAKMKKIVAEGKK